MKIRAVLAGAFSAWLCFLILLVVAVAAVNSVGGPRWTLDAVIDVVAAWGTIVGIASVVAAPWVAAIVETLTSHPVLRVVGYAVVSAVLAWPVHLMMSYGSSYGLWLTCGMAAISGVVGGLGGRWASRHTPRVLLLGALAVGISVAGLAANG